MKIHLFFILVAVTAVTQIFSVQAWAQNSSPLLSALPSPAPANAPQREEAENLNTARQKVQEKKEVLTAQLSEAQAQGNQVSVDYINKQLGVLNNLDVLYIQHIAAMQRSLELSTTQEKKDILSPEPQTLTFAFLDNLKNELAAEKEDQLRLNGALQNSDNAVITAKKTLDEKEAARRQAKEIVDSNPSADAQRVYDIAIIESDAAKEALVTRELELKNAQNALAINKAKIEALKNRTTSLGDRVKFTEDDLKDQLTTLSTREKGLRKDIESAQTKLALCDKNLFESTKRMKQAGATPDPLLNDEAETYRLCRDIERNELLALNERLYLVSIMNDTWSKRFKILQGTLSLDLLPAELKEVDVLISDMELRGRTQNSRLSELRKELSQVDGRLELSKDSNPALSRWLKEQSSSLQRGINVYGDYVDDIDLATRQLEKLKEEVSEQIDSSAIEIQAKTLWSSVWSVWNYELVSFDDKPITIRKLIVAIFLVVLGFWVARRLSLRFSRYILPRLGLSIGETAAFESLAFYTLVVIFTLFALQLVHVPLTVFTFLGGAVAIGVGFGSQNIMNNFISGLILLIERPIRVGDLVEVEGLQGRVQHIGARSTRILTGDNVDLVVPNSALLEKNVINWTLGDEQARTSLTVSASYAHDPEVVKETILHAVKNIKNVMSVPAPFVILSEFGDSGIAYKVFFWVRLSATNNKLIIESDVRCEIDRVFRERKISIPYTHRDVTFRTKGPLAVKMVSNDHE